MLRRRFHSLRKASRRYWSAKPSIPPPESEPIHRSAVTDFFATLSSTNLQHFAQRLRTITIEPIRAGVLAKFRDNVIAGTWGDRDSYLPFAIELLKQSPADMVIRLVTETLATIAPTQDVRLCLLETPERLLWLEDLVCLLPANSTFQFPSCLLTTVSSIREAVITKSLSIGDFVRIRTLSQEQWQSLLRIFRIEQINEVEEVLIQTMTKAFELVDLALVHRDYLSSLLRYHSMELENCEGRKETIMHYLATFDSIPLREYTIPSSLKCFLEPADQTLLTDWLSRIFTDFSQITIVLPITLSDYLAYSETFSFLSEREQLVSFQRELLRLCFPQILLSVELSQESIEEKERLEREWYLYHSFAFSDYMRESVYNEAGKLVAVFTRDQRDSQLRFDIDHIREKMSAFVSIKELQSSIEAFLHTSSQRLYVLDCFQAFPQALDLTTAKAVLEEACSNSQSAKMFCILVRLSAAVPILKGSWSRRWKLIAIESLTETFSSSLKSLRKWLKRDTRSCLVHKDFVRSREKIGAVLAAIYEDEAEMCREEIMALSSSDNFCQLLGERMELDLKESEDWKQLALTHPQHFFLQENVDNVLISQAVSVLTPVITTVKQLQAFPAFLSSSSDSLIQRLWKATFLSLVPGAFPLLQHPSVQLQYPFLQCDYCYFVSMSSSASLPDLLAAFRSFSVTSLHLSIDPAAISLLPLYSRDIAALDLAEATYSPEGKQLLEYLCGDCKSFEELVECYFDFRDLVLLLCKAEKLPLLDNLFAEILATTASGTLKAPEILRNRLSACSDELQFLRDPSIRLYAVDERNLHMLNCLHKRTSRTTLSAVLSTLHPSLLLLHDSQTLFCCGGQEPSSFRVIFSAQTYTLTLPNTVASQAKLRKGRGYHGLALTNGYVYAMGGNSGSMSLSTCEKFSLDSKQWQWLSQTLATGRAYFNPLVYREKIYLFGGFSCLIEVVEPKNDAISSLSVTLPIRGACISLLISADTALVLSESKVCEVNLDSLRCKDTSGSRISLWSSYPPVLHHSQIFFVDESLTFQCLSLGGMLLDSMKT